MPLWPYYGMTAVEENWLTTCYKLYCIHFTVWCNQVAITRYVNQSTGSSLVQVMVCCLNGNKPFPDQWWIIVNWTLGSKLQSNLNQDTIIAIEESPLENAICKMADILFRPQCSAAPSVDCPAWGSILWGRQIKMYASQLTGICDQDPLSSQWTGWSVYHWSYKYIK